MFMLICKFARVSVDDELICVLLALFSRQILDRGAQTFQGRYSLIGSDSRHENHRAGLCGLGQGSSFFRCFYAICARCSMTLFVHVIDSQDMERFEARLLRHPLFSSSNLKVRRFAVVLTNLTNPIVFVL